MKINRKNLLLIVVALSITLVMLLGGQFFWKYFALTKPLDQEIMKVAGVNSVSWKEQTTNKTVQVMVSLNQVTNIRKSYLEIMGIGKQHFPKHIIEMKLQDTRDARMEQFYDNIHLHIYEAIETGSYTKMQDTVQKKAKRQGMSVKIFVDSERVYIHIAEGTKNLYEVIPKRVLDKGV